MPAGRSQGPRAGGARRGRGGSLSEAHRRGIVHRDLKPSNVFVTEGGGISDFVKVLDFGIARPLDPGVAERVTATGAIVGTPAYLAPEAIAATGPIDARADLYTLGAPLFFLLTGRPPFEGGSAVSLLASHLREPPSPLRPASGLSCRAAWWSREGRGTARMEGEAGGPPPRSDPT